MKDLNIRDDIVITKADKGAAVAIIDVGDYINEANLQLNNKQFYKEILNDPTELNRKKSQKCNQRTKICKITTQKIATQLEVQEVKAPTFHMFPKHTSQKTQDDQ